MQARSAIVMNNQPTLPTEFQINIGCGATPTEGWVNLDNSFTVRLARWPSLVKVLTKAGLANRDSPNFAEKARQLGVGFADATREVPYPSQSIHVIYSSHMLEHLDRRGAIAFLTEARRVLVPHGVIRVVVPDLRKHVTTYLESNDGDRFIESLQIALDQPRTFAERIRLLLIGPRHHLWMYDGQSLSTLLTEVGFVDTQVLPPGETTISNPGRLNLHEREDESLYVEARKPE